MRAFVQRWGCAIGWCLLLAHPALAHEFPTTFDVLSQRDRPERFVVALRPGLALTEDGGEQWNFLCGSVSGIAGNDRYAAALTADGHLLIGAFTGVFRDDGMGCGWSAVTGTGLPAGQVVSLALLDNGDVEALTAMPGIDNGLFVSRDHGVTWSAHGPRLTAAMPTSLVRAPSDAQRLYVAGSKRGGAPAVLWISHDGGQQWDEKVLPGDLPAEVIAVDPNNPERVFLRRSATDPLIPDTLTVSNDGGVTHSTLFEVFEFGGMALTPDGETLWIGSRAGGLYRAMRDEAPQQIDSTLRVGCLHHRDGLLWVCARDQGGFDPFALATSADLGDTLEPWLRSDQLRRLRTCGNPMQASRCSSEWNQWKNDVFGSTSEPPLLPVDAGVVSDAATQSDASAGLEATMPDAAMSGSPEGPPRASVEPSRGGGCELARSRTRSDATTIAWFAAVLAMHCRLRSRQRARRLSRNRARIARTAPRRSRR